MLTIGVDSHKRTYVAAAVDAAGRPIASLVVDTTAAGRTTLVQWALRLADPDGPSCLWGIEGSGSYGRPLAQQLARCGYTVFEVPGLATSHQRTHSPGQQRTKTDLTDALAIARVVLRDSTHLSAIIPADRAYQCKLLTEHRDNLVLERTRALNQLQMHLTAFETIHVPRLNCHCSRRMIAAWAATRIETTGPVHAIHAQIIQQLASLVQQLDDWITDAARALADLVAIVAPQLVAVPGLGVLTAAKILGEVGTIQRFATPAKFAAYAGVAPLEVSSGDRRRYRLSRRGNRQLNRALHQIAVTQRRCYPEARAYLERKVATGKTKREALRGLKRHLSNVVFRLLRNAQSTAVPEAA